MRQREAWLGVLAILAFSAVFASEEPKLDTSRGDRMIAEYFRLETQKLQDACLTDVKDLADWKAKREEFRRQLLEMLGLDPWPERTDLHATVTGRTEHEEFVVEKLHFQSRPGLYVTGNLYVPRNLQGRAPAILYVCGHGALKKDGVSFGNKVSYQHHGGWFARNGYVCLTIDTLQMGEIEGIHHGTYRYKMWWWLNRGYTPAGVEAWNCVRALDYLQTRPEVDPERLGVTGRSGGVRTAGGSPRSTNGSRPPSLWPASRTYRTTSSTVASRATATACTWSTRTAGTIRWWPPSSRRVRCC